MARYSLKSRMHKCVLLLIILVPLLIGYGCAEPTAQTQQKIDFNAICARRYHTQTLALEDSPTPEAEEYEVYAAVLEAEFIVTRTERIIIQNGVVEDGVEGLSESAIYAAEHLTVTEDLLDDFHTKNQEVYRSTAKVTLSVTLKPFRKHCDSIA